MPQRLQPITLALDLFAVPAFLTDPCNRFVWVNQMFARMVGDPIRDRLPATLQFVPAAMLGPYRDRFPQAHQEVVQCLPGLYREVDAGRLAPGTLGLLHAMFAQDQALRRAVERADSAWDGTVVVKEEPRKRSIVCEHVIPVTDTFGKASGFHVSLWLPLEQDPPLSLVGPQDRQSSVASRLTPKQRQLAQWYAAGLTSRAVAARAGISWRTARTHLEHIYARLGIRSRAELALLFVREGLL
jgi:DNA-binding CsgD family transcriptional regulator